MLLPLLVKIVIYLDSFLLLFSVITPGGSTLLLSEVFNKVV